MLRSRSLRPCASQSSPDLVAAADTDTVTLPYVLAATPPPAHQPPTHTAHAPHSRPRQQHLPRLQRAALLHASALHPARPACPRRQRAPEADIQRYTSTPRQRTTSPQRSARSRCTSSHACPPRSASTSLSACRRQTRCCPRVLRTSAGWARRGFTRPWHSRGCSWAWARRRRAFLASPFILGRLTPLSLAHPCHTTRSASACPSSTPSSRCVRPRLPTYPPTLIPRI
jgi:hypothetical protein